MKKLMNILVLSCKKASLLIEKKAVRKLSLLERLQLKIHTRICEKCANYQTQSLVIEGLLKNTPSANGNLSDLQLSQKTKEQIQRQIDENLKKN